MAIRRIGQIFVDLGFITEDQLELLLEEQKRRPGDLLGKVAESQGYVTDEQLAQALAEQMGMRVVNLSEMNITPDVLAKITETMAQMYRIVPLEFSDNTLTIAMCDPQKLSIRDELRTFLGYDIKAMVATEREIAKALAKYYATGSESVESLVADMEQDDELREAAELAEGGRGADRPDERRGHGRQCAGAEAVEHGAAAGDPRSRQ